MTKKKTTQTWGMMPIRKLEDDEEENYADVGMMPIRKLEDDEEEKYADVGNDADQEIRR